MTLRMKKFTKFLLVILASLLVIFACGSSMGVELFRDGKGSLTVSVKKERVVDFAPDKASFEEYFNDYVETINSVSGDVTALDVKKITESKTHYHVTLKTRRIDKISGLGDLFYGDMEGFLNVNKEQLNRGYQGYLSVLKAYPNGKSVTYRTRYERYQFQRDENDEIKYKKDDNGEFILDESGAKQPLYTRKDAISLKAPVMKAKSVESGEEIKNYSAVVKAFSAEKKSKIVFFRLADFQLVDEITLELPGKVKYVSFIENKETDEQIENVSVSGKTVTVKAVPMKFVTADKIYEQEDGSYTDVGECEKNIFYGYFVYEEGISPWAIAGIIAGVAGFGTFLFFGIFKGGFKRFFHGKIWKGILRYKVLYLLILPAFVLLILFRYLPMLWLSAGFMDYNLFEGLGSEWIGLHYFKDVFFAENTPEMYRIFRNTIFISLIRILSNLPVILFLAILINSIKSKKGRTVFQAISFIPYFLSWVSVGGIFNALLDPNSGMLNKMLGTDINWYGYAEPWWAILSASALWKGMGWSTLIYISAMCTIDSELYEACALDGGGKLRQVFTVTLPGIMNTICLQLILDVSNIMRDNYEQILAMTNGKVAIGGQEIKITTDVVGRISASALTSGIFGSATAIGLIQGVIGSALVLVTNKIVKKTENEGII